MLCALLVFHRQKLASLLALAWVRAAEAMTPSRLRGRQGLDRSPTSMSVLSRRWAMRIFLVMVAVAATLTVAPALMRIVPSHERGYSYSAKAQLESSFSFRRSGALYDQLAGMATLSGWVAGAISSRVHCEEVATSDVTGRHSRTVPACALHAAHSTQQSLLGQMRCVCEALRRARLLAECRASCLQLAFHLFSPAVFSSSRFELSAFRQTVLQGFCRSHPLGHEPRRADDAMAGWPATHASRARTRQPSVDQLRGSLCYHER